ncbi:MAG: hypothetical protein RLZZ143_828 [Cyanobacteriota bacterium]|jgi:hypothetical protein
MTDGFKYPRRRIRSIENQEGDRSGQLEVSHATDLLCKPWLV